jgi:hypothetical protein
MHLCPCSLCMSHWVRDYLLCCRSIICNEISSYTIILWAFMVFYYVCTFLCYLNIYGRSRKLRLTTVGDPPHWPCNTPLPARLGIKFRQQVAVAQSVWFACWLKATEFFCNSNRARTTVTYKSLWMSLYLFTSIAMGQHLNSLICV